MEGIISSKEQNYSLVQCRALFTRTACFKSSSTLRRAKESSAVKKKKRKKKDIKIRRGNEWRRRDPCCRETIHGSCRSGGVAVLSVSLAASPLCRTPSPMNPRTLSGHLDFVSVSHHKVTSCWFISQGISVDRSC